MTLHDSHVNQNFPLQNQNMLIENAEFRHLIELIVNSLTKFKILLLSFTFLCDFELGKMFNNYEIVFSNSELICLTEFRI